MPWHEQFRGRPGLRRQDRVNLCVLHATSVLLEQLALTSLQKRAYVISPPCRSRVDQQVWSDGYFTSNVQWPFQRPFFELPLTEKPSQHYLEHFSFAPMAVTADFHFQILVLS